MLKLSVIGLGKLGACTAACFATKGFEVIGVDINKKFVDAVNNRKAPFYEPQLQEFITSSKGKLRATQDYEEAIEKSDITFLIVPTPSEQGGHFSDRYLQEAIKSLSESLKRTNKDYHLFVIVSTVSPGTIEQNLVPLIESISGKKVTEGFGVCYNPEFIALGSVIQDFLNPDVVLIGESDKFAGEQLAKVYENTCENKPYIAKMSIISAEISKISLNSYITMKVSFANTLASICGNIPNADIDSITEALGCDKRISPYYLKGATGYGGPCFPRDNRAYIAFAKKYDCEAKLAQASDEVNKSMNEHLVKLVLDNLPQNENRVTILGLAYKPNTSVIEESPAVKLIKELIDNKIEVNVYDSLAIDNTKILFGNTINYANSVEDCMSKSSVCVITTPCEEFKHINDRYIVHNPTTIIDCWRIINNPALLGKQAIYLAFGKANQENK